MKAVLVFLEGTLCDARQREPLRSAAGAPGAAGAATDAYYRREEMLKDAAVPGGVRCMQELASRYKLVYLGARPEATTAITGEWLQSKGFPAGEVFLAVTHEERLALVRKIKKDFDFIAGIGGHWSDNELHLEIGCESFILKPYEGQWDTVRRFLLGKEHTALQQAVTLLTPWANSVESPRPLRMDVSVTSADVLPAVTALHDARWGYLCAVAGVDLGPQAGQIEVLYTFCAGAAILVLRARTPRDAARVPSVCAVIPSATLYERELMEMLGVTVEGTPNSERLFLPDDWPAGVYPLRKDFIAGSA